jgi:protein TonB
MVPPEELEQAQPATLPADFSEWDGGEAPAAQPPSFNGFEAVARSSAPPKPAVQSAPTRVAAAPAANRPPNAALRSAATVHANAGQVFQPAQPRELPWGEERGGVEGKEKRKGMVKFAALGAAAFLLIAGALGYFELRPKTATPKPGVAPSLASSPATVSTNSMTNSSTPPKPTAATPAAAPTAAEPDSTLRAQSAIMSKQLAAPSRIPNDIRMLAGQEPPPSSGFNAPGGEGMGASGSVFNGQTGPKVKIAAQGRLNISAGVAGGMLIQKTAPIYPQIAKEARISGTVVIQATISKTGTIINSHALSGPAGLRQAALDAVRSWRYRPYQLNGEPVEVETTVSVVFNLGQ